MMIDRVAARWLARIAGKELRTDTETLSTSFGSVTHIRIKGHGDRSLSWEEIQNVKDRVAGKGAVAIEIFPKSRDVVNVHNVRHLWVLPDDFKLPFGLLETENGVKTVAK